MAIFSREKNLFHPAGNFDTAGAKVALVLAGCGAKDGAEITEAVSLLIAFSQLDYEVSLFAPDRLTHHTVNHLSQQESTNEERNCLVEAARIGRGNIQPLLQLEAERFDALFFCGGFGAAKNLCDFAFAGKEARLQHDVERALIPFLKQKKPVGALCIAPIIIALGAKQLGLRGYSLTLGDGSATDAVLAMESWGGKHVATLPHAAHVDENFALVSAPAYMYPQATPSQVFASAVQAARGLRQLLMAPK